ncbi:hypothetical protein [Bosea vaviloviae]|uniref:hypothetical protein n=1 Tax=Bosea vaviloviae TaxID=1526658 RepID=UPI001FCD9AEF|nr:hypothetical protein [Bosea vaviloviae]
MKLAAAVAFAHMVHISEYLCTALGETSNGKRFNAEFWVPVPEYATVQASRIGATGPSHRIKIGDMIQGHEAD